ncbi:MAG: phosphonate ABC transporter, permease protein PhnE, partial [Afipia sp.]|nr:phosphonate ABC transporter, permease protein PhnE [Afipia sp.]
MTPAVQDAALVVAKYPALFHGSRTARRKVLIAALAAFALFVFGCWYLDFSLERLIVGTRQLGWFILLMIPPD